MLQSLHCVSAVKHDRVPSHITQVDYFPITAHLGMLSFFYTTAFYQELHFLNLLKNAA